MSLTKVSFSMIAGAEYNIKDFGAVSGSEVLTAVSLALTTIGSTNRASLVFPEGTWVVDANTDWSAYKNVTFIFYQGAVLSYGTYNVTLPQNVETGTAINNCFSGTGVLTVKNKDVFTLTTPPGGWLTYSNYAIGVNALKSNTAGTNNYAWGANALRSNTLGSSNIAIGNDTLKTVQGTQTVAIGTFMCYGWGNIAIGDTALRDCTTGYENMALGQFNLQRLTTGAWNTAIGPLSQITTTTGSSNTSVGSYVLTTNNGSNNTVMGWAACEVQVSGGNSVYGFVAMNANQTGSLNCAFGADTLRLATTPANNCTFGQSTLENATGTPDSNCVFGTYAMASTTGSPIKNNAFGTYALQFSTGLFNNAFGAEALQNVTSGANNVAMGQAAGRYITTGTGNTAVGHLALSAVGGTARVNNTAVGINALVLGTGSSNTALGAEALGGLTTETNSTGLGANAAVTGSNQVQLGDSATTTYAYGAVQNRSDARDKADIRDTQLGLSFINALRPVDFKWDYRDDYRQSLEDAPKPPVVPGVNADKAEKDAYEVSLAEFNIELKNWIEKNKLSNIVHDGSKKRSRFHHGLISQEVKAACDAAGVEFGGYQDHSVKGGDDVLSIGYEELIAPLIKAVQELSAKVAALEAK
jgi:hypothetical protein